MWLYFVIPFYETRTVGDLSTYGEFIAFKDEWIFYDNYWFFPLKKEEITIDNKYRFSKSNGNIIFAIFDEEYEQ